jgi:GR25 family glycosyltransferase involved in LPS biosynthesis
MSLINNLYASFVNLDIRDDRLRHMQKQFRRIGLRAVRQKGILPHEVKGDRSKYKAMLNRTPGALGCHMSQVEVMKKALDIGKHAFVMEDDLVFCTDFNERLEYIERFLDGREWDVFWLGATFHSNPPVWHKDKDAERTEDPRILRTYGIWSTYAYIVNHSSISKIINLLDENVHDSPGIDTLFIKLQPQLNTFCFIPGCVKQFDNKSNIGTGMTVFSNFASLGAYWYQETMHDFNPDKLKLP